MINVLEEIPRFLHYHFLRLKMSMFIFMLENEKQEKWNYHYLGNQNSINLGTKQQWEQRKKIDSPCTQKTRQVK